MRRFFNFITSDTGFFRLWMVLSIIGAIIHWNNTLLTEINIVQFLIATGVITIVNKLDKKNDEGDEEPEESKS